MRKKLTDLLVKRAKPRGSLTLIWDTEEPGLVLKVTPAGKKIFTLISASFPGKWEVAGDGKRLFRPKEEGEPRHQSKRTIGVHPYTTLAEARAKVIEWRRLIGEGTDPESAKREAKRARTLEQANTFGVVAERFIEDHLSSKRRGKVDTREIRREIMPVWQDRPITSITRLDVVELVRPIAKRAPGVARLILGHVKRIFTWAIEQAAYGIETSPAASVRPQQLIGDKKPRTRVLNDTELRVLWKATEPQGYPYGPLFRIIALTGVRVSEAAGARWREFDLSKRLWVIPRERFKSDAEHLVPLSDDAVALLEDLPKFQKGDHLFTTTEGEKPVGGFSKAKARLDNLMTAELCSKPQPFVIHDVRRTVRTRLSELKVEERVAEMVIGHGKKGLSRIYDQHEYLDEMRGALQLWAARLRAIVNPNNHQNSDQCG
jgi:integrase